MVTDPKPKRGRPKVMTDEQRRAAITAVARLLFIEKGYGGTSTCEIASKCRISKQTLYRIFPGKLELFAAVVDVQRAFMIDLDADYDDMPLHEALERIFMITLDQEAYETRAAFLRTIHLESIQYPELREILKMNSGMVTRNELKDWLDRQCRIRGFDIPDTDSAARMLMDVFTGAIIFEAIGGFSWKDREHRVAHFRQCVQIVLHGLVGTEEGES